MNHETLDLELTVLLAAHYPEPILGRVLQAVHCQLLNALSTLLLCFHGVTDLFANTAATAEMFVDTNEGALVIVLAVGKGRTPQLIQAPSAHVTFVGHPKNDLLLLSGNTPFE